MTGRGSNASPIGSKEVAFYLRHLVEGEVLVLGAGPGTVALGLARAGRPVVAIEPSERMREMALAARDRLGTPLQKACSLEGGDLFTLSLGRTFANVIAPGFAISALGSAAELDAFAATVTRHLAPKGSFAFEASGLWGGRERLFRPGHWRERPRGMRRPAGRRLTEQELDLSLSRAGLVVRERYGDFDDRPAEADDPRRLWVAGFPD